MHHKTNHKVIPVFFFGVFLLACSFFIFAPAAHADIAFVQVNNNHSASAGQTSISDTISTTAGDLLVVVCREGTNSTDNFTISDSGVNSWTQTSGGYATPSGSSGRTGMFYSLTSGADTSVTCNFTTGGGISPATIMVMEFSGVAASPADGSANATNTGVSSLTSGSLTTSNANDVLIYGVGVGGDQTTFTVGGGFTIPSNNVATGANGSNARMAMQYKIVTSTFSGTTSMSDNAAFSMAGIFAAFKVAVPGTPGTPTYSNIGTSTLTVNWTAASNATYYTVARSTSANGSYSNLTPTTTALFFNDLTLATGTSYWYKVDATNTGGAGAFSATSTVATSAGGPCGTSNISSSTNNHWAWNDSVGWIDFCSNGTVNVTSTGLSGYASSSVGDISLDCSTTRIGNICGTSNYQVTNDGSGNLSGWGWNDTYGWISFDCNNNSGCGTSSYQVSIGSGGSFNNFAWNDAIGWISFNCANSGGGGCGASNYKVQTTWTAGNGTAANGTLDSTTYDTGIGSGAQLNSFLWHGSLPSGTTVSFQFAVSNSSSGPWNYMGSDGTSNTYYIVAADTSQPLDYTLFNGYRYFRYRITLYSNVTQTLTPRVDEVIVNWSP